MVRWLLALICILLFAVAAIADEPFDGKCPICKSEGEKSKVYIGMCTSTVMYCGGGHYDEDGKYQSAPDCNHTTCSYTCSRGHSFSAGIGSLVDLDLVYIDTQADGTLVPN